VATHPPSASRATPVPAVGRRALLGAVLAFAVTGCGGAPAPDDVPTAGRAADAPLLPAEGAYLGVYYGDRPAAETDEAIGVVPQLHLTYVGWTDEWTTSEFVAEDAERGQLSLVNWEPFDADFTAIVDGAYDEMLTARAREAGALDRPVFVDLAAEMNEEEGWGGHDPELYVAAYRHVHDVFAAHDEGNVVWMWAPNNVDSADAPGALAYYPGEDYVDWTGIDGYNWGTDDPDHAWGSFTEVFGPMYEQLQPLGKPIMIGETGSSETGGSKAAWIAGIVPALRESFPDVRALVWFDVRKERDWRIGSSDAAASAFRDLAADEHLAARVP
jgi:hypothetical protein